jgi:hypothetical protein
LPLLSAFLISRIPGMFMCPASRRHVSKTLSENRQIEQDVGAG